MAALDHGAGAEQAFDYLIVQNRQAVQSMRRLMDWTLQDNMVDRLSLNDGVDKAGISTMAPDRSAVLYGSME